MDERVEETGDGDDGQKRRRVAVEMNGEADESLALREEEVVKLSLDGVESDGIEEVETGAGRLVVTTARVVFMRERRTVSFPFEDVLVHAISTDTSLFPRPCIYCHIAKGNGDDTREVRFIPAERELQRVFTIFSECSSLIQDMDVEEGDEMFTGDAEEASARWDSLLNGNGHQFEDAEEEDS